jgi:hypothetical protein
MFAGCQKSIPAGGQTLTADSFQHLSHYLFKTHLLSATFVHSSQGWSYTPALTKVYCSPLYSCITSSKLPCSPRKQ